MKIRSGFVSNSSSSSFCILGVEVSPDDYDRIDSIPYNKRTADMIELQSGISNDSLFLVGYSPEQMKDDETLSQFKDRIVAAAAKVGLTLDKDKLSWFTDGGYNG